MTDQAEQLAYLAGCVACFVFAAHSSVGQRRNACLAALALLANWLFCQWTYTNGARQMAAALGSKSYHFWPIADLAFGITVFILGYEKAWGWALWYSAVVQICLHVVFVSSEVLGAGLTQGDYIFWLDQVLRVQMLVFVIIGGRGVGNRITDIVDAVRLRLRSLQARSISKGGA